jgi:uncharacterized protein
MFKGFLGSTETKIFAFFEQDAENLVKMARQLNDMLEVWQNIKQRASVLADMEQDGDAITHDIMKYLYRSFLAPLDREDITTLANSLDDIADGLHLIADTLYLYQIESPTAKSKELGEIIFQAISEVKSGVLQISTHIKQAELLAHCVKIHEIENTGDKVYHVALAELFALEQDIFAIVKWREIYKKMGATIEKCEKVADILEGIAIKYV